NLDRAGQLHSSFLIRANIAESFPKIAAKQRTIWLQHHCRLNVLASLHVVPAPDLAKSASQPCVAQGAVEGHGMLERIGSLSDSVLCAQDKTTQRKRGRVQRCEGSSFLQRSSGVARPAETKFQLSHARPGKTEGR